jgi:hypothetical protein
LHTSSCARLRIVGVIGSSAVLRAADIRRVRRVRLLLVPRRCHRAGGEHGVGCPVVGGDGGRDAGRVRSAPMVGGTRHRPIASTTGRTWLPGTTAPERCSSTSTFSTATKARR